MRVLLSTLKNPDLLKQNQYFFKQQYIHGIKRGQGRASYISSVRYAFANLHLYFVRIKVTVIDKKNPLPCIKKRLLEEDKILA